MPFTENINQRQKDSFENVGGDPARRVSIVSPSTLSVTSTTGSLLAGLTFDYIAVTYPLTTQEVYTYRSGGVSGTIVAVITVNYSDDTKSAITSVAKT
jgi:hypothetical protein